MLNRIIKLADCPAEIDIKSLEEYRDSGINTYVMTEDYVPLGSKEYAQAIMNCQSVGLDVYIRGYGRADYFDNCDMDFNQFPCVKGFYLWDEPNGDEFVEVAKLIPFMSEKYPDKIWHVNLYPSYGHPRYQLRIPASEQHTAHENYVNKFVDVVLKGVTNVKDVSLDYYPLREIKEGEDKGKTLIADTWLLDLYTVKSAQKPAGAQFFNACIQVYRDDGSVRSIRSKADIVLQVFTSLAFGAKSLEYYLYKSYETDIGMILHGGAKNKSYYYVQQVNKDLATFEEEFVQYEWLGVALESGDKEPCSSFKRLEDKKLKKVKGIKEIKVGSDTIIGSFENKDGELAYVLVNFACPEHKIKQDVRLVFENKGQITVYLNGTKSVYENADELALHFDEGDGAFVTFKEI